MNILVINGVNLNVLEFRGKEYGEMTLEYIEESIKDKYVEDDFTFFQSNYEGDIINTIQSCLIYDYDGVVINAGAFTHYSYAIYDALLILNIPVVEVHLSDINEREDFRKISVIRDACTNCFMGRKLNSYFDAIDYLKNLK